EIRTQADLEPTERRYLVLVRRADPRAHIEYGTQRSTLLRPPLDYHRLRRFGRCDLADDHVDPRVDRQRIFDREIDRGPPFIRERRRRDHRRLIFSTAEIAHV